MSSYYPAFVLSVFHKSRTYRCKVMAFLYYTGIFESLVLSQSTAFGNIDWWCTKYGMFIIGVGSETCSLCIWPIHPDLAVGWTISLLGEHTSSKQFIKTCLEICHTVPLLEAVEMLSSYQLVGISPCVNLTKFLHLWIKLILLTCDLVFFVMPQHT